MRAIWTLSVVSALAMVGCVGAVDSGDDESVGSDESAVQDPELKPNGRGHETREAHNQAKPGGQAKPGNGISYHGGPVMLGTIHLYYIWYGNWAGNTASSILTDLGNNIGGSPYWNINTTYGNASTGGTKLSNSVTLAGQTNYPAGGGAYSTSLTDANIQSIVSSVITSGALPKDANGIYFVLTSADVNATSGFCTQYCGWHTHATIGGTDIKYSFVGNPDRCPASCEQQSAASPNGNPGADGMASILIHEAEEAATDPDLNAWYDTRGAENADKCAWTFGTTQPAGNGSVYNMTLGNRNYLIQQNWVNASGGYCAKSF